MCFLGISQAIAVYTGLVRAWSHGYPQSHGIVGNVVEVRIPHVDQNRLWALVITVFCGSFTHSSLSGCNDVPIFNIPFFIYKTRWKPGDSNNLPSPHEEQEDSKLMSAGHNDTCL